MSGFIEFVETSVFTQRIQELLSDEEYRELQSELARNPKAGDVIPAGNGLRKVRWKSKRKTSGKRGGIRIIYYYLSASRLYMIFAYDKALQGDLTRVQLKILSKYVKEGVL